MTIRVPPRLSWIIESRRKENGWQTVDACPPRARRACEQEIEQWLSEPGDSPLKYRLRNITTGRVIPWPKPKARR